MSQTIPRCVNHPDVETRLACSSCGDPICTSCMRQSAVGQKCPRCAQVPRSARALGKPIHYVKAAGAGFGAAVVGGLVLFQLLRQMPFGRIILSAFLGFAIGRAVGWGAQRQQHRPFEVMAVGFGIVGALLASGGLARLDNPFTLLAVAAAGFFALRGLRG